MNVNIIPERTRRVGVNGNPLFVILVDPRPGDINGIPYKRACIWVYFLDGYTQINRRVCTKVAKEVGPIQVTLGVEGHDIIPIRSVDSSKAWWNLGVDEGWEGRSPVV